MTDEGKKMAEAALIIGVIPCYNQVVNSIWAIIKGPAAKLAKLSGGEYEVYDVYKSIWFGQSFLYAGYMCDSQEDFDFASKCAENANLLVAKYITLKKEKDFAGYTLVRLDDRGAHIWQAYIPQEYRNTPVFEKGLGFIREKLAEIGVRNTTFTSPRAGWGERIGAMGFKEGMTSFHMAIAPSDDQNDHMV